MRLALKIDVSTLRGIREGVPNLVEILRRHRVGATFLFSLGPDRTGRALGRVLQPEAGTGPGATLRPRYGPRALLYGTLLPAPDMARRGGDVMRATRDAGFEVGLSSFDPVGWHAGVASADAAWTRAEIERACERFTDLFKEPPRVHAAAGWQSSLHALRLTQSLGFAYCSDGRGRCPHLPVWCAELIRCPQFPTTLPALDELVGRDGITPANVAAHLLASTHEPPAGDQVFTARAELEGLRIAKAFDQLVAGWKAQGWEVGPIRSLVDAVEPMALPRCEVAPGRIAGRRTAVLLQGEEFLSNVDLAQAA